MTVLEKARKEGFIFTKDFKGKAIEYHRYESAEQIIKNSNSSEVLNDLCEKGFEVRIFTHKISRIMSHKKGETFVIIKSPHGV